MEVCLLLLFCNLVSFTTTNIAGPLIYYIYVFAFFCCFFIDGKEGEGLKWTSETTTISFLRNVFWLLAFCLGAKFANSLIKFRQKSESYSSCIRVSDLKPFKILRLRFAKNCRKMYPGAKRTCTERMKCVLPSALVIVAAEIILSTKNLDHVLGKSSE